MDFKECESVFVSKSQIRKKETKSKTTTTQKWCNLLLEKEKWVEMMNFYGFYRWLHGWDSKGELDTKKSGGEKYVSIFKQYVPLPLPSTP